MGTKVGRDLCKPEVKQIVVQTINIVSFISFNSPVLCSKLVYISFSISNAVSERFCSPEDSSASASPSALPFGAGDISGGIQVGFGLGLGCTSGEKC